MTRWNMTNVRVSYRLFLVLPFCHLVIFSFCHVSTAQDFGRRQRTYDVSHYRIEVRLDEAARRVDGETDVTLQPLRTEIDTVTLDAVGMDVASVTMFPDRDAATQGSTPGESLRWTVDSARLHIHLPRPLRHGDTRTFRIRYSCTPRRGLYFIGPSEMFPDDPRQIWTQGQGEDNRHWFPCYDFPNDKATSEVVMTVDTALRAISNGELLSRRDNGDGTATWHFRQDRPHCSYLVMLAAGRYGVFREEADGVAAESWFYPSDDPADVRRTFDDTADMLRFFSAYTGVAYPWVKYSQLPVRHFLYGGMENTSATIMADTRLVVDARAALDYDPQPLIAHELAHQWFGDYVTYIDWDNEWLNEGFATFFQQLWTRERLGEDDFILQRFNGIRSYLDWADGAGRIPVVGTKRGGAANTYSKGAAVLHMLRDIIGEEEFRRVIRTWLERHALGSVETNDFKRTIEDVTGRAMPWFFQQWLYGAGYPHIRIERESLAGGDSLRVSFRQVQATDSLCGYFRLPLTLRWPDGRTERVWIDGDETVASLAMPARDGMFFEVDPENLVCGRIGVDYTTDESIRLLREAHSPAQRLLAAEALVVDIEDGKVRDALFAAAADDAHREVRKAVATLLSRLQPEGRPYAKELRDLFVDLTRDSHAAVRSTALNGLYNFRDPALLPLFHRMLEDSSYYVEASAMNCILAIDTAAITVVQERLRKASREDVLALAALDWVHRYRMTALLADVRRLAGPGNGIRLRRKAIEILQELAPMR